MTREELLADIDAMREAINRFGGGQTTSGPFHRAIARLESLLAALDRPGVDVRIAVSVAPDKSWIASGDSWSTDDQTLRNCDHKGDDRLTWVTARVPLPEVAEVEGSVEP